MACKPFNYWPVVAFLGAWEISCDHNRIVLMSRCLDVCSFACRKLNFYSTHITYILQLHTDDNYIMYMVFVFIHSIDRIWLIVVWKRHFLSSLIPTYTSEMKVEAKQITDGISGYLDGWEAAVGASAFLHMTQMLIEPWRTRSAECFGSVHLVCSIKPHIVDCLVHLGLCLPSFWLGMRRLGQSPWTYKWKPPVEDSVTWVEPLATSSI